MNDMRPIDKGESPYEAIREYQEAEPYLSSRIGRYCSFCELPIFHVPEVEHKEGKRAEEVRRSGKTFCTVVNTVTPEKHRR